MTVELSEQDSAIIIVALELREMQFPPNNYKDRERLPKLKKELSDRHNEVFLKPRVKEHKRDK